MENHEKFRSDVFSEFDLVTSLIKFDSRYRGGDLLGTVFSNQYCTAKGMRVAYILLSFSFREYNPVKWNDIIIRMPLHDVICD
jgi:hypothetical protein